LAEATTLRLAGRNPSKILSLKQRCKIARRHDKMQLTPENMRMVYEIDLPDCQRGQTIMLQQKNGYICNMVLSNHDTGLLRQYFTDKPVKRVYLFGSYARNTAVKGTSDIDIMLELDYSKPIGMKFFSFQRELEDLLHNKVDVVTSDGLSKYVLPYIEKDKILIYEAIA